MKPAQFSGWLHYSCMLSVLELVSKIKVLLPFGLHIVPLSPLTTIISFGGTLFGPLPLALSLIVRAMISLLWHTPLSLLHALHIPSLAGMYLWSTFYPSLYQTRMPSLHKRLLLALIPASCMVIFWSLVPGAWLYGALWLFPIATIVIPHRSSFLHALASTGTVHALGSLLWLFTHPMTDAAWLALIPIVCIERICLATVLTALLHGTRYASQHLFRSKKAAPIYAA